MQVPYALALVKTVEGPVLTGQVVDTDVKDVRIGLRVRATFRKLREEGKAGVIHYGYKFAPAEEPVHGPSARGPANGSLLRRRPSPVEHRRERSRGFGGPGRPRGGATSGGRGIRPRVFRRLRGRDSIGAQGGPATRLAGPHGAELRILIESRLARVAEEVELKHKSLLGPPGTGRRGGHCCVPPSRPSDPRTRPSSREWMGESFPRAAIS